jgi:hypothetical protein
MKQRSQNMSTAPKNSQIYHDRADHEDNLHMSRTKSFISCNAFFAVAMGIVADGMMKLFFSAMILIVNFLWFLWARNGRAFIRLLRDKGKAREDEMLWNETVGESEKEFRWLIDPLTILSIYIPSIFTVGWLLILVYLIESYKK